MTNIRKVFFMVLAVFVAGLICGNPQRINAEEAKELKLGILPVFSYMEVFNRAKPLRAYIEKECGMKVNLVFSKDIDDYFRNAELGMLDILYVNPAIYIKLAPKAGVRPKGALAFARIVNDKGNDKFRGTIAARVDSRNVQKLEDITKPDLKGMCTAKSSAAGFTSQKLGLADKGIDVEKLNLVEAPTQKHEEVLMAVFNREIDFGFYREDTPEVLKGMIDMEQIKVLGYGVYIPEWNFCFRPGLNQGVVDKVKDAILKLNVADPEQAEVLKALKVKSIVAADDKDWDEYRAMCDKVKYEY